MKKYILTLLLFASAIVNAQKSINDYQYVIVPTKFEFTGEDNLYRLNTITKFNLTKMGFKAYYDNEDMPADILDDRCSKLYVDVKKVSTFLVTKLSLVFKDCQNNIVYTSPEGKSRSKEYKNAYPEALNDAFASMSGLGYAYNGKEVASSFTTTKSKPAKVQSAVSEPKSSPQISESADYLFAQPIANGYQLVDKTPKIVLKIYKTSQPDYFTAQSETKNGAVIKKDGEWIFEYYKDDQPISEKLLIKF